MCAGYYAELACCLRRASFCKLQSCSPAVRFRYHLNSRVPPNDVLFMVALLEVVLFAVSTIGLLRVSPRGGREPTIIPVGRQLAVWLSCRRLGGWLSYAFSAASFQPGVRFLRGGRIGRVDQRHRRTISRRIPSFRTRQEALACDPSPRARVALRPCVCYTSHVCGARTRTAQLAAPHLVGWASESLS
jgi:hypothetical protein